MFLPDMGLHMGWKRGWLVTCAHLLLSDPFPMSSYSSLLHSALRPHMERPGLGSSDSIPEGLGSPTPCLEVVLKFLATEREWIFWSEIFDLSRRVGFFEHLCFVTHLSSALHTLGLLQGSLFSPITTVPIFNPLSEKTHHYQKISTHQKQTNKQKNHQNKTHKNSVHFSNLKNFRRKKYCCPTY